MSEVKSKSYLDELLNKEEKDSIKEEKENDIKINLMKEPLKPEKTIIKLNKPFTEEQENHIRSIISEEIDKRLKDLKIDKSPEINININDFQAIHNSLTDLSLAQKKKGLIYIKGKDSLDLENQVSTIYYSIKHRGNKYLIKMKNISNKIEGDILDEQTEESILEEGLRKFNAPELKYRKSAITRMVTYLTKNF